MSLNTPSRKQQQSSPPTKSSTIIGLMKFIYKLVLDGSMKSGKLFWVVLKAVITSIAPALNLEITSTPSIDEFPKRMGVNTKLFMTLDWSIPLMLNIKSPIKTNVDNRKPDLRRITFEKQH